MAGGDNSGEWSPIETAPQDGTPFIALNHDREIFASKFIDGKIVYRMNSRCEPRRFEVVTRDGEELLREDKKFASEGECWRSTWTYWSRLYEFTPTHWMPLPTPPSGT